VYNRPEWKNKTLNIKIRQKGPVVFHSQLQSTNFSKTVDNSSVDPQNDLRNVGKHARAAVMLAVIAKYILMAANERKEKSG